MVETNVNLILSYYQLTKRSSQHVIFFFFSPNLLLFQLVMVRSLDWFTHHLLDLIAMVLTKCSLKSL